MRIKVAGVAGAVAITALASSLWVLSTRLERQMAGRITDLLVGAESTFTRWEQERQDHLRIQARIIARDPRFFAATAEHDAATTVPAARQFQQVVGSALFLVCDDEGRPLAHLNHEGEVRSFGWPRSVPPADEQLRWGNALYLLQTQAVTVGSDTVGYVALGDRVDANLATVVGQIAGVDVVFFDDSTVFGASLPGSDAEGLVASFDLNAASSSPAGETSTLRMRGKRYLYRVGRMIGGTDGFYSVIMSLDDRLEPVIADMRHTLLFVGLGAIVLAVLLSFAVAKRVTRQVPHLVDAVEAVARGDYERAIVHRGRDELNTLAQAVERMRHELAAQMKAIEQANAEKIADERLAVIGKMASTIIHDFKTPMQVIRTSAELSAGDALPAVKRAEYGRMIERELDRMVDMAQELLEFARGDRRMARCVVDIDTFLADAVASWRQIAAKSGIEVRFDADAPATVVSIDKDKIHRALNNIVVNAMEVLGREGKITISTRAADQRVTIRIADTGPGIPEEIRQTIFEPFATFGKAQGTGLGLAMARKAVEDHQGAIRVDSAPGTGTTFSITLPTGAVTAMPEGNEQSPQRIREYAASLG
ncbi:MAG: HAMP domain-containing sensor histidine kinase [Candidatus Zixiibacteriota bacterium]